MKSCHCGSGAKFSDCCQPYISGDAIPASAEILMRSRYSAYVMADIDYIVATHVPEGRENLDIPATKKWAEESEWQGLEIIRTEDGQPGDEKGMVEFKAMFREDGEDVIHHEVSYFVRQGDRWYFDEGYPARDTYVRDTPKVGRNDPCPCGSGKKYKKCCGAA